MRTETLTAELRAAFARHLGVTPAAVDPDEPIELLGLDSLAIAQVAIDIEERIGVIVFLDELTGYETITQLAAMASQDP
jgi:acyl carrier protein